MAQALIFEEVRALWFLRPSVEPATREGRMRLPAIEEEEEEEVAELVMTAGAS